MSEKIERYLLEVIHEPAASRITCLRCGSVIRWDGQHAIAGHVLPATHTCLPHVTEHWHTVARDAFLEGRDAEAITIICEHMNLTSTTGDVEIDAATRALILLSVRMKNFIRRIPAHTKHGPQGRGGGDPCSPGCVKCEAEEILKSF